MNTAKYETFFGKLGKNPNLKYTANRKAVCDFTVAIYQGEDKEPIWKNVQVWEKDAEQCSVHLRKGDDVFVHGLIVEKEFETNEGKLKRYKQVKARRIGFANI